MWWLTLEGSKKPSRGGAVVPSLKLTRRQFSEDAICEGVVVPEGGREGTQGYQLRLETAPVLVYRFLIIGVEL